MNAKIENLSEMEKVLRVKDTTNVELMSLFGRFGLGNLLRHLSLEKCFGISAVIFLWRCACSVLMATASFAHIEVISTVCLIPARIVFTG